MLVVVVLWASCVAQSDGTLLLWARDHTRRGLLGIEVPASLFPTLPALLVLVLSPAVNMLGRLRAARSGLSRLAIGMWSTGLAMATMAVAALVARGTRVSALWLLCCFVVLVVGEIPVAPLSQSILMGLVPNRRTGLVLAMSYGSMAVGYWLAGMLGALWIRWPHTVFFGALAALAVGGGFLPRMATPRLAAIERERSV